MLPWNKTNAAVSVDSACLEETDLRKLFAGGGDPSGQASLVGHLDGCARCQNRLQVLAAGNDFWSRAVKNLRESVADEYGEPTTLMARLETRWWERTAPWRLSRPARRPIASAPAQRPDGWDAWGLTRLWRSSAAGAWAWSTRRWTRPWIVPWRSKSWPVPRRSTRMRGRDSAVKGARPPRCGASTRWSSMPWRRLPSPRTS